MPYSIALWLAIGYASTLLAISLFRKRNQVELMQAATGPFLGPVISALLIRDLIRRRWKR